MNALAGNLTLSAVLVIVSMLVVIGLILIPGSSSSETSQPRKSKLSSEPSKPVFRYKPPRIVKYRIKSRLYLGLPKWVITAHFYDGSKLVIGAADSFPEAIEYIEQREKVRNA